MNLGKFDAVTVYVDQKNKHLYLTNKPCALQYSFSRSCLTVFGPVSTTTKRRLAYVNSNGSSFRIRHASINNIDSAVSIYIERFSNAL